MPRNLSITAPFRRKRIPAILRTEVLKPREHITNTTPRLWNAKRRIKTSQGMTLAQYAHWNANSNYDWRSLVSPDVADFYDQNPRLLPKEKRLLFTNPSQYFSRPYLVPETQRKQIYPPRVQHYIHPHADPRALLRLFPGTAVVQQVRHEVISEERI